MTATSIRFTSIPMWVQFWGLPFDLLSEEVGRDIGNGLGKVVEVDLKAFSSDQAHFLFCTESLVSDLVHPSTRR